jgi:hypothetical protein
MRNWFQADLFKDVLVTVHIGEVTKKVNGSGYSGPSLRPLVISKKSLPPEN